MISKLDLTVRRGIVDDSSPGYNRFRLLSLKNEFIEKLAGSSGRDIVRHKLYLDARKMSSEVYNEITKGPLYD